MATKRLQLIGNFVNIDNTLTQAGQAADAKVTGDAINQLQANIDETASIKANSDDVIALQELVGETSVSDQISSALNASAVLYSIEQPLTEDQKAQARTNIGIDFATDDEVIEMLTTLCFIEPITDAGDNILTNAEGKILIL